MVVGFEASPESGAELDAPALRPALETALISDFTARVLHSRLQLLLGHRRIESTVRYLGIEVDDALAIAEQVDV